MKGLLDADEIGRIIALYLRHQQNYEILTIAVFVKGNSMRLLGPNGSHLVHSSNNNDIIGCMREAELVWKLTDVFAVARDRLDSEEVREKIEQLKQRAAQLKKAA